MLVYGAWTMNSSINIFEISHLNMCDLDIVSSVADRDFRLWFFHPRFRIVIYVNESRLIFYKLTGSPVWKIYLNSIIETICYFLRKIWKSSNPMVFFLLNWYGMHFFILANTWYTSYLISLYIVFVVQCEANSVPQHVSHQTVLRDKQQGQRAR